MTISDVCKYSDSTKSSQIPHVWIITQNHIKEIAGKYSWEPKTYQREFGNVLYMTHTREGIIMKAIEMYLDKHDGNEDLEERENISKKRKQNHDSESESCEFATMKLSPNVLITEADDVLVYNDAALYDMMKCCTEIGAKADHLKLRLKKILSDWNNKEDKHLCNLATFTQQILKDRPEEMQKLLCS